MVLLMPFYCRDSFHSSCSIFDYQLDMFKACKEKKNETQTYFHRDSCLSPFAFSRNPIFSWTFWFFRRQTQFKTILVSRQKQSIFPPGLKIILLKVPSRNFKWSLFHASADGKASANTSSKWNSFLWRSVKYR